MAAAAQIQTKAATAASTGFSDSDGDLRLEFVPLDATADDGGRADTLLVHVPQGSTIHNAESQRLNFSFPATAEDQEWSQPMRVRASVRRDGQEYAVEFLLNTTRHELDAGEQISRHGHELRLLDNPGRVCWFGPVGGTAAVEIPTSLRFVEGV